MLEVVRRVATGHLLDDVGLKAEKGPAMCVSAALETVVGDTAHGLRMPRHSEIQFVYHRIPNLDWTGIDPPLSMNLGALTLHPDLVVPCDAITNEF